MKLFSKILIALGIVLVVLFVAYQFSNCAPSSNLSLDEQAQVILEKGRCLMCHSENGKKPFYYDQCPIAREMMDKDIAEGYKHADLTSMYEALNGNGVVDEVTLAKLERVAADRSMPPGAFTFMHWGSTMTKDKAAILTQWVKKYRYRHYTKRLAHADFVYEPIRPIPDSLPVDPEKVALGYKLFHDVRLSGDNTVSCASCHELTTGGVDNKQYSEGVAGQFGGVNAPTVYNSTFNFLQFWDGRAADLAEQAGGPPFNPVEMASASWDEIIGKLEKDASFTQEFLAVYPEGYSGDRITEAIAEFEKTLITPNSRFDKYLKGDRSAITAQEVKGYELFKEKKCVTCHVGVNLGGLSFELMGLKEDYFGHRGWELTEEDDGRFKETKIERDKHRFKTPGLRNVALTAPYMHDGSLQTLEEAVNHMARFQVGNQLTTEETADIVAFLKTLTGEYQGVSLEVEK